MATDADKLALSNRALFMIGAARITDFEQADSTEAEAVNAVYDDVRDEFLMDEPWSFAQLRTELIDITEPSDTPDDWVTATAYVLGDYVVSGSVNYACIVAHTSGTFATDLAAGKWQRMATEEEFPVTFDNVSRVYYLPTDFLKLYKINSGGNYQITRMLIGSSYYTVLLANAENLHVIYIYRNDDPDTYSGIARTAFATRLAAELTLYLKESSKTRTDLMEEYHKIWLPKARSKDSQQNAPETVSQHQWEMERLASGGAIYPPFPGAETWFDAWGV